MGVTTWSWYQTDDSPPGPRIGVSERPSLPLQDTGDKARDEEKKKKKKKKRDKEKEMEKERSRKREKRYDD